MKRLGMILSFFVFLSLGVNASAAPSLSPSSGTLLSVGQNFTYEPNDSDVDKFVIFIGTGTRGAERFNIARSRALPGTGGVFASPPLPVGTVYVTLFSRPPGGLYSGIVHPFDVTDSIGLISQSLLAELGCGVDELIKTTPTGWECIPESSISGTPGPEGPQGPPGPQGPQGPSANIPGYWAPTDGSGAFACGNWCGAGSSAGADPSGYVCKDNRGRLGQSIFRDREGKHSCLGSNVGQCYCVIF